MVDKVKLSVKERETKKKGLNHLRNEGLLPAVMYGKDKKPMTLELDAHEFALMYKQAGGNTIINLEVEKLDGTKEKKNVLVHDIAVDPVKSKILHADFLQIKMNEKITATVSLKFVGDSVAVMDLGGSLLTPKTEVEIECLPGDLLHEIEVDLSVLAGFDDVLHVSDIVVPEGVVVIGESEEVVALVEAPRSDEELAEMEAPVETAELPESENGEESAEAEITEDKTE